MKKLVSALVLCTFLLSSGCGILLPKKVEFFQDKVHVVPEQKASEKETLRQAAKMLSERTTQTLVAATAEGASTNVITPAKEAEVLAGAVSTSVGPPAHPSQITAEQLAVKLDSALAALNKRLDDFKKDNNENSGKKIEGTGLFQIGYFSMWAIIIGGVLLIGVALKIYGMVNPVVGVGVNAVGRVSSAVLKRGISEVAQGGEWFKEYVEEQGKELLSKKEVMDLFSRAHTEAQSRDVQTLVEGLTKK